VLQYQGEKLRPRLEIANNTEFGLTGARLFQKPEKIRKAEEAFHVGNLDLNRKCTARWSARQPFGGFNMSGQIPRPAEKDYFAAFPASQIRSRKVSINVEGKDSSYSLLAAYIEPWEAHFIHGTRIAQIPTSQRQWRMSRSSAIDPMRNKNGIRSANRCRPRIAPRAVGDPSAASFCGEQKVDVYVSV